MGCTNLTQDLRVLGDCCTGVNVVQLHRDINNIGRYITTITRKK